MIMFVFYVNSIYLNKTLLLIMILFRIKCKQNIMNVFFYWEILVRKKCSLSQVLWEYIGVSCQKKSYEFIAKLQLK